MDPRAKKLIIAGIVISLIGSVVAVSAANIIGWVDASIDRNLVAGIWLARVIITTVQLGVAPLGAALIAIGLAIHWFGSSTFTVSPNANNDRGVENDDGD